MDAASLDAWLTLHRLHGIGPRLAARILEAYADPAEFLAASDTERARRGLPASAVAARASASIRAGVAADRRWAERAGHHIITRSDPRYPAALRHIDQPPSVLFIAGDPALLAGPQIAVVGTRKPSRGGIAAAEAFAGHLASAGLTVTSGLAQGIDAAAHEGALLAPAGTTIAVMASGPEHHYPRDNARLAGEIAGAGALVTEMPVGTPLTRGLFPRRNRLIAGLALAVVVIEAGRRSGALNTARLALEQGREVMAMPGSIHSPVSKGCHALIRDGAGLVEDATEVIDAIRGVIPLATPASPAPAGPDQAACAGTAAPPRDHLDAEQQALLEAMGFDPIGFESLARRTSLTPERLSSMLLGLELTGHVAPCNGGHYMQIGNRAGG